MVEQVPQYRFDASGPGCGGDGHDLSCLCDVVPPVPASTGMHLPCMAIAKDMLTGQITPAKFEQYMATVLGIYEFAHNILEGGVTVDDLEEARSAFLDVWSSQRGDATVKRPYMREALQVYREAGMTFRQIANHLRGPGHEVGLPTVVRVLNRGDETAEQCYQLALIEGHLRAGVDTYDQLVEMTGLSWDAIAHFAQRWGYKTLTQQRREAGGGNKNSAATIALVRELRCQGLTPKKILAAVHEALPESRETLTYHGMFGLIRKNQRR